MGYRKEREALAGIVQAMLMTKHMLFVGFSFNDPNFHQIVHEVRRATANRAIDEADSSSDPKPKMGTNLTLVHEPYSESLWQSDLDWVPMLKKNSTEPCKLRAARHLEIFLDRVALEASDATEHLMDIKLKASLPGDDQKMMEEFQSFLKQIDQKDLGDTDAVIKSTSWQSTWGTNGFRSLPF